MKRWFLFICTILCNWHVWSESVDDYIRIPLEVHSIDGKVSLEYFEYTVGEQRIEFAVANFCENFQIKKSFCRSLYTIAKDMQRSKQHEVRSSWSVSKQTEIYMESNFTEGLLKYPSIINAELGMYSSSINSELTSSITPCESRVLSALLSSLDLFSIPRSETQRIIVIHSLTLIPSFDDVSEWTAGEDYVLSTILQRLYATSGLVDKVYRVFVLNYGYTVPLKLQQSYSSVEFIQVSDDVSQLDLPSLRILRDLSARLEESKLGMTQLLFLPTIGAEYMKPYPSIADLREMLLHFMVDEHQSAFHLLSSGEFDAVTVNHHESQYAYWATARHLARLPLLSGKEWTMQTAKKWVTQSSQSRLFVAHSSTVDHLHQVYPPYCYSKDVLQTRRIDDVEFKAVCGHYQRNPSQTSACGDSSSEEECHYSAANVSSRRSYAICMGLEINCKSEDVTRKSWQPR